MYARTHTISGIWQKVHKVHFLELRGIFLAQGAYGRVPAAQGTRPSGRPRFAHQRPAQAVLWGILAVAASRQAEKAEDKGRPSRGIFCRRPHALREARPRRVVTRQSTHASKRRRDLRLLTRLRIRFLFRFHSNALDIAAIGLILSLDIQAAIQRIRSRSLELSTGVVGR